MLPTFELMLNQFGETGRTLVGAVCELHRKLVTNADSDHYHYQVHSLEKLTNLTLFVEQVVYNCKRESK